MQYGLIVKYSYLRVYYFFLQIWINQKILPKYHEEDRFLDFFWAWYPAKSISFSNQICFLTKNLVYNVHTVENTSMNPKYFICMYWAIFYRLTVNQNIFQKLWREIYSPNIYASFGTFWVKNGRWSVPQWALEDWWDSAILSFSLQKRYKTSIS